MPADRQVKNEEGESWWRLSHSLFFIYHSSFQLVIHVIATNANTQFPFVYHLLT